MDQDLQYVLGFFRQSILNQGYGNVAGMLIHAARTQKGAPDQQVPGSLLTPGKGGEKDTADDLRTSNHNHGT